MAVSRGLDNEELLLFLLILAAAAVELIVWATCVRITEFFLRTWTCCHIFWANVVRQFCVTDVTVDVVAAPFTGSWAPWACASSCAGPGGRTWRSTARTPGTWTAWPRCASGSAGSVRRTERSATGSPGSGKCTAFHLKQKVLYKYFTTILGSIEKSLNEVSPNEKSPKT